MNESIKRSDYTVMPDQIRQMIRGDEVDKVANILDTVGLNVVNENFQTAGHRELAAIILGTASAVAARDELSHRMVEMLFKHLALHCELFEIAQFIVDAAKIQEHWTMVPILVRKVLRAGVFNPYTCNVIRHMEEATLRATLNYIATNDAIQELDSKYCIPLLECVYHRKIISHALLLAYMAGTLSSPKAI